ncbi:Pleckstrin homology domain-containing protein [Mycena alexandri]|uniref:Pleckstrin homology domain-containing protein n=1 Tax=Mycena alexandri TaxID=1745969 RepID=A0AAD6RYP9_9AGAR|nr:Pleckstrin homology domain-containing protein [Mycena alexandri]
MSLSAHCAKLLARLMLIRGFPNYVSRLPVASIDTNDPITQLWDMFALGVPLCYIFDLLPEDCGFNKINHSEFIEEQYDANPDRAKLHATVLFAMQIRTEKVADHIPDCEAFTVTDLWDRNSTDGFAKAVATVTAITNYLPHNIFIAPSEKLPAYIHPPNEAIRQLVETERSYVRDLETMQNYATVVAQSNLIGTETYDRLFANTNELVNFHRKFLAGFNATAELPWQEQRWGLLFLEAVRIVDENNIQLQFNHLISSLGKEFGKIYPPYYMNYFANVANIELTLEQEHKPFYLLNECASTHSCLSLSLRPHWPLSINTATSWKGVFRLAKRVTDMINEARRRGEKEQTMQSLRTRLDDWKGNNLENFGALLLDDTFDVVRTGVKREYHVFFFEEIMVFCKEVPSAPPNRAKNTPLLNKGRIFLSAVLEAVVQLGSRHISPTKINLASSRRFFLLTVHWKGNNGHESFTVHFRREDQMNQWEKQINRLKGSAEDCEADLQEDHVDSLDQTDFGQLAGTTDNTNARSASARVKVNFGEDLFLLHAPRVTDYDTLVEMIQLKLQLCGPRSRDGPLRLTYKDEDGDTIVLSSSDDVRVAFGECQFSGGLLELYVT